VNAAEYRLRSLAGEATQLKVRPFKPALLRALPFRAFDGKPFQLWALTPAGYGVAGAVLGRLVKVPRVDVGAAFAEHSAFLTDLFVELARPFVQARSPARELPFRWDVAEDVELPWRERGLSGAETSRVIRPDAVLEVPGAQRRFFIECERGTHTLTPLSPDKVQATVRKVERYEAYVSGIADYRTRLSHYQHKYADGWPCEVLLLVQTERRQRSTNEAVAALRAQRGTRVPARAFTLEEAADYCRSTFPRGGASSTRAAVEFSPRRSQAPRQFYGEHEHGAVKGFVVAMTAALAAANSALQRNGFTAVAEPECKAEMLDFLRKAQAEMHRQRTGEARHG
jgi:Replication-relaxation